jgi:hypothetical protein
LVADYYHVDESDSDQQVPKLVELPLHYGLEDEPYFVYNLAPPVPIGQPRISSYREILSNWKHDFDAFHRFGLCFVLRLRPEMIDTADRIDVLHELLDWMCTRGDTWFATGASIAAWWRSTLRRHACVAGLASWPRRGKDCFLLKLSRLACKAPPVFNGPVERVASLDRPDRS